MVHGASGETTVEQIFTLQPMEDPMLEQRISSEGTAAHGDPTPEQTYPDCLQPMKRNHSGAGEMCEEEGATERNQCVLTLAPCSPSPLCLSGRAGGVRTQGRKTVGLMYVSHYLNLF